MIDAFDAGLRASSRTADAGGPVNQPAAHADRRQALELVNLLAACAIRVWWRSPWMDNEALAIRTGPALPRPSGRPGRQGLRRTVHAGESSGPGACAMPWSCCRPTASTTGVRAIRTRPWSACWPARVPLGICPSSNLALGCTRASRRIRSTKLRQASVRVSLNTDDPVLEHAPGARIRACRDTFGWDDDVLRARWPATRSRPASPRTGRARRNRLPRAGSLVVIRGRTSAGPGPATHQAPGASITSTAP